MLNLVNEFLQAILSLDRITAKEIWTGASNKMTSIQFVEEVIVDALEKIGVGWENGTIALSQIYMSGRICEELVDDILPSGNTNRKDLPKMAIAVLLDHHTMGKRIVYSFLRAGGFDLLDYGRVAVDDLVRMVKEDAVEILLLSVLMLPSALHIKEVRKKLNSAGLDVKIVVGGAPFRFDEQLWREMGADAMCHAASEVVTTITKIKGGIL